MWFSLGEEWEKEGINTALSTETYIENVVKKLTTVVGIEEFSRSKNRIPMRENYYPELDDTDLRSHQKHQNTTL